MAKLAEYSSPQPTEASNSAFGTGRGVPEAERTTKTRLAADIHGFGDKSAPLSRVMEVASNLHYSGDEQKLIENIYDNAKAFGKDRGADIIRLLNSLATEPNREALLKSISEVATAKELFGTSDKKIKSGYLCDILRMSNDITARSQGNAPLCTAVDAVKNHLSCSEFIRTTTEYALKGRTTTTLGDEIIFKPILLEGLQRDYSPLPERKVYVPTDGMEAFFRSVMAIGTPIEQQHNGSFRQRYCAYYQSLSGYKTGFREKGEKVPLASNGEVRFGSGGTPAIETTEWLSNKIEKNRGKDFEEIKSSGVSIDVLWGERNSNSHQRHMCTALKPEIRENWRTGAKEEQWLISNPQGVLLEDGVEIPSGKIRGNENFEYQVSDTPGCVWISAEVVKKHLQGAVIISSEKATRDDEPDVKPEVESNYTWLEAKDTYAIDIPKLEKKNFEQTVAVSTQYASNSEPQHLQEQEAPREETQVNDGAEAAASTKKRGRLGNSDDEFEKFLTEPRPVPSKDNLNSKEMLEQQFKVSGDNKPKNSDISRFISAGFNRNELFKA